ncbi:MAG TPA: hypothetical protein VGI12_18985 [Vicinamibacterales bacterium]|jgi:photosystem II stability/assembly factor-like uncharacterized protein
MRHLAGALALAAFLVPAQPQPRWEPQISGVTARLRGISTASNTVAWASGADGTVLRTADGGAAWTKLHVPDADKLDFRDVDAASETTAWILSIGAGPASRIYKTTDAGAHWTLQFTNEDARAFFDAMAFWDSQHGLAMSDSVDGRFVILTTDDGGSTWARVAPEGLPPALPNEGGFAGSGTNVAVQPGGRAWIGTGAASNARVLQTDDGGRHWRVVDTPVLSSPSAGIFSVAFRDPQHGLAVGGDYRRENDADDNAASTGNGGRAWTLVRGLGGFRSVVAFAPGSNSSWIAVGPQGADWSDNDGASWTAIPGDGYHAFAFAPSGAIGWGVGENGRIGCLRAQFTRSAR